MKADWYNVIRLKNTDRAKNGFRSRLFDETQGAQQEQRLQAIIDAGYYQQSTTQEGMSLDVKVPLSQVYEVLANHEHLVVTEQGQAIGEVTRTDIFHFLSQEEQDAKL